MSLTTPGATAAWWPDTTNPFDAALAYHNAGLCVIPLSGKRPALGSWKHYQKQRPPEAAIRRWQQEGLLRNVGIVCGAVSAISSCSTSMAPAPMPPLPRCSRRWRKASLPPPAAGKGQESIFTERNIIH